jgi:hypothetical protein
MMQFYSIISGLLETTKICSKYDAILEKKNFFDYDESIYFFYDSMGFVCAKFKIFTSYCQFLTKFHDERPSLNYVTKGRGVRAM